jgi:uncharacterized membrane protein
MNLKSNNFKNFFLIIVLSLIITNFSILFDIPILRQIGVFFCFIILPGLLILQLLMLGKITMIKKVLLSVGLSVSFLMFFGLFINNFCIFFGFSRPLSTVSLAVSFNVVLILLLLIIYIRKEVDPGFITFNINYVRNYFRYLIEDKNLLISPLVFPIIFPILSVFGTYLMNFEGNNILLITMLFLIPVYLIFVIYLNKRIPITTYPVAILMISISLLLMHGLRSSYVNGSDVHGEYYAFQVVLKNAHWNMSNLPNVLTACLSTSLLPAILQGLLNINGQYIYKLVYQLIFSMTPLAIYLFSKKYVSELYAFLAAIFYTSQSNFFYLMQSAMRTEIAIFFFTLTMIIFFDDEIDKINKNFLFIVFVFSTIVSHYATSYIFLFLFISAWMIAELEKKLFKLENTISIGKVALLGIMIFLWYAQVTESSFAESTAIFFKETINNMAEWFISDIKASETLTTFGVESDEIPNWIMFPKSLISNLANVLITIGIIGSLIKYKNSNDNMRLILMVVSWLLLFLMVVMPYTYSYELGRLYSQVLVFLALPFIVGCELVTKSLLDIFYKYVSNNLKLNRDRSDLVSKYSLIFIMLVLIPYFFCNTYIYYQILGIPYTDDLNNCGIQYSKFYISDRDVIAAKWLCNNIADNPSMQLYTDYFGNLPLMLGFGMPVPTTVVSSEKMDMGYVYLRNANVVCGIIYTNKGKDYVNKYSYLFYKKDKIYSNNIAVVYFG